MACERPQRGQGGSRAGHPPAAALPLGAHGARTQRAQAGRKPRRSLEELEAENRRLRAENAKLLEQREVLKKSLGILSEVPPRGMPGSKQMSGQYKVAWLCEALLVSRSGYYDWQERRRQPGPRPGGEHPLARAHPRGVCPQSSDLRQSTAGSCAGLPGTAQPHCPSHALGADLRPAALQVSSGTTDSRHGGPIAPNRVQNLAVRRPDQVWVTDATGVLTGQGWLYLVAVLDVFTRRVVGWAMSPSSMPHWSSPPSAWPWANAGPRGTLIVHSDRGSQFASAAYRQVLAQHGLLASMSRKGNCYDNAFIESFWSSLKYELVYHHRFATPPRLAPPSSTTSRPSITAPDSTPVLTISAPSTLNPN